METQGPITPISPASKSPAAGKGTTVDSVTIAVTTTQRTVPVNVSGVNNAVGVNGSCAVLSNGQVQCWDGYGLNTISGIDNAVSLGNASKSDGCALLDTGRVKCWERNRLDEDLRSPTRNIYGATRLVMHRRNGCVVLETGKLQCWSDGYSDWPKYPAIVSGIDNVVDVSVENEALCVLQSDGVVKCFGDASHDIFGGAGQYPYETPPAVTVATGAVALAMTGHNNCITFGNGSTCSNYTRNGSRSCRRNTCQSNGTWAQTNASCGCSCTGRSCSDDDDDNDEALDDLILSKGAEGIKTLIEEQKAKGKLY